MVRVYNKKTKKEVSFGELTKETKTLFKIHSSSIIFKKNTHTYKREI